MTARDVADFERCIARGGIALFPADTVYGLAADPGSGPAVERLYGLKGRPPTQPAAVMFFSLERLLDALPELPAWTRVAAELLLPGAVTLVLANPRERFRLACGPRPERLGVRVPNLSGALAPLTDANVAVLQTSANPSGGHDARRLEEVDPRIRAGVDVVLDGGELPGTPSTVVELASPTDVRILREGALPAAEVRAALAQAASG